MIDLSSRNSCSPIPIFIRGALAGYRLTVNPGSTTFLFRYLFCGGNASRRVLILLTNVLNTLLKLSFFTIAVFIPNHRCSFRSSEAGGMLSRYFFQLDKRRSISERCFELMYIDNSPFLSLALAPQRRSMEFFLDSHNQRKSPEIG